MQTLQTQTTEQTTEQAPAAPKCHECAVATTSPRLRVNLPKAITSKLCVVVENPSPSFDVTGELLSGPASKLFWYAWKQAQNKLDPSHVHIKKSFAIVSAIACKVNHSASITPQILACCHDRFVEQIEQTGCDYILTLGAGAYTAVNPAVGAKSHVAKIQGTVVPVMVGSKMRHVIPAYHPVLLMHSPTEFDNFCGAIEKAVKALYEMPMQQKPKPTVWRTFADEQDIEQFISSCRQSGKTTLCCDIETSSLTYNQGKILCFGVCNEPGIAFVVPQELIKSQAAKNLLDQDDFKYIWHNGKFDRNFLNHVGYRVRIDEDTILLHYLLNESAGTHGLELLAIQLLGANNYKAELKGNLDDPKDSYAKLPQDTLYQYQAQDVDYGFQVWEILRQRVDADRGLAWCYRNIMIPAQNFLSDVELRGFYTHIDKLEAVSELLEMQIEQASEALQQEVAPVWDSETYTTASGAKSTPEKFLPSSPKQVAWLLYTKMKLRPKIFKTQVNGVFDTGAATLESIEPKPEIVVKLLALRKLQKLYTTYVVSILQKRDEVGRIHSTYSLYGTATGRLASKKPNLQNIPRDGRIKTIFGAPKGRLLIECDYKSAELRALALYSNDPFLVRVFKEGLDMHDETALAMFGPGFTKNQRVQAKMINFGIMYGRGARTISESCNISIEEAQDSINRWLARMPQAAAYLKGRRDAVRSGCVLCTPFGRQRRFPLVSRATLNEFQNEACNFAIQSIASDFTLMTGIRCHPWLRSLDCHIVNLVHDSLLIELPDNKALASEIFYRMPREMAATARMYFPSLPFDFAADASIGRHWGELTSDFEAWLTGEAGK